MKTAPLSPLCLGLALALAFPATAADSDPIDQLSEEIARMQARIDGLQQQLESLQAERSQSVASPAAEPAPENLTASAVAAAEEDGITLGGAVRFQYSNERYNEGNRERGGDLDFDIFRLDLHGSLGDVELSAQYRWFQYMSAIHHAWVGYHFNPADSAKLGVTRLPFGNQPFNSHSYFFSSNYYLGLEDAQHMGLLYEHDSEDWNLQLGFFKNDSMGGVDGFVSNRSESYTYNIVGWREPGEGSFDDPLHPAGTSNTLAARSAWRFSPGAETRIEVGVSALFGDLESPEGRIGQHDAEAIHLDADHKAWNLQLQASRHDYRTRNGADRMAVGAYAFHDSIAASARSYSSNLAYSQPVSWGPITDLTFYNDYTRITKKSGGLPDTWMNVSGLSVAAGGLFTYFDFVTARNQPFIGGSMTEDGPVEHRFNINFGYYF